MWSEFNDPQTMKKGTQKMIELFQECHQKMKSQNYLVAPNIEPGFLRNQLPEDPPEEPSSIQSVIEQTKSKIVPGLMLWNSPKYFGYFPSNTSTANVIAEMFGTVFHSPGFSFSVGPAHTELENIMVDWTAKILGLPEKFLLRNSGGGVINSSITESTFSSVHSAKRIKMRELSIEFNNPQMLKFVGYFTDFCHVGTQKGLKMKEIFYRRSVPSKYCEKTKNFVVMVEVFQEMIQKDIKEGLIPFWYGCTYGSTFSCANDLDPKLISICKKYGVWINIDAAYLGSSWICPQQRPGPNILENIDSITINFAKAMLQGGGGSLMYVANKKQFIQSMEGNIEFGFFKNKYSGLEDVVDYKDWIVGLGRKSHAFKFFYMYKHYGIKKLRDYVRETVRLADYFLKLLQSEPNNFCIFSPVHYGLVCFQIKDKDGNPSNKLTKKTGEAIRNIPEGYLTPGEFNGYNIIRLVVGNPNTNQQNLEKYWKSILQISILERQKLQ